MEKSVRKGTGERKRKKMTEAENGVDDPGLLINKISVRPSVRPSIIPIREQKKENKLKPNRKAKTYRHNILQDSWELNRDLLKVW